MTYDLRRLRLHGLIARVDGTHRYTLTATGLRVAFFYTTLHRHLLQFCARDLAEIPAPLHPPVRQLDAALHRLWTETHITRNAA
jgi:hypothetical protein